MKIGILGDTHEQTRWCKFAFNKFHREGITTILQLGDFGIYRNGQGDSPFLDVSNKHLKEYGQTLYVTPGNHEDYDYINEIPVSEDGWQHLRSNILLAPRGHRWEWEGRSFVSLGGAPSVDRHFRLNSGFKDKAWWGEEFLTREDVDKTVAGGHADVMVAHDAPFAPSIDARIAGNPHGFHPDDIDYAYEGRLLMDEAFRGVQPNVFLHGHYHFVVNEMVNGTHVCGFGCNGQDFSLGHLDTDTLGVAHWELEQAYRDWTTLTYLKG